MTKGELLKQFQDLQLHCLEHAKDNALQAIIGKPDDFESNKKRSLDYYNSSIVWERALTIAGNLDEQQPSRKEIKS